MQQRFTIAVDAPPERVFPLVADLKHYPELLDIVHGVTLEPGETSDDDAPSWTVTLRAKLGPLARSKRLRMERTTHEPVSSVRFERRERDGRDHSDWTLEATVRPTEAGTTVTMTLDYGGRLWTAALKGVLESQVAAARENLRLLADQT